MKTLPNGVTVFPSGFDPEARGMVKEERDKAEVILRVSNSHCRPDVFTVNNVCADVTDFGAQRDLAKPDEEWSHGCGDMQFLPVPATSEVLEKYHISVDEYDEIVATLADKLSFGACWQCE